MRLRVQVGVVVFLGLLVVGGGVIAVGRIRQAAMKMECRNHLKQMGISLQAAYEPYGFLRREDGL